MKLVSCDSCGIVLDGNKLPFDYNFHLENGSVDESKAKWSDYAYDWIPFVKCPCCNGSVLDEDL